MHHVEVQIAGGTDHLDASMRARRDTVTVLIPAAGAVADAPDAIRSSALTPVAGKPVVQWTIESLIELGVRRFVIAVPIGESFVEDVVRTLFGDDADVSVVQMETRSVGDSIGRLAELCTTEQALVVLGDTFVRFDDELVLGSELPVVLTSQVDDSYRWCTVTTDQGIVTAIADKVPGLPTPCTAMVGGYWFPSVADLRRASSDAAPGGRPGSIATILDRLRQQTPIGTAEVLQWHDAGNSDRRGLATQRLLAQRAFNTLSVDELTGTITKRSTNITKFVDEIAYLVGLPTPLQVLFPRVVDHSLDLDDPWICLEFYGYPTLAELFVYHGLDRSVWERVFTHVAAIQSERFAGLTMPLDPGAVRSMYLDKLDDRLEAMRAEPRLARLIDEPELVVNGRRLANLPAIRSDLDDEVERLAAGAVGTAIHGDLCLSNILYDLRSSICRFIDPRGSFGRAGHAGDLRYDVAKLWHSVHGCYDLITADLFNVRVGRGPTVELDLRVRPDHRAARDAFEHVFFPRWDRRDITLICGLMMCSIPALHYDHPDRQVAMYVRGLQLVDEAMFERAGLEAAA